MDLYTQAQEDLQRERLIRLFNAVFPWALACLAIVLVAVGGYEAWRAIKNYQNRQHTAAFMTASLNAASLDPLVDFAKQDGSDRAALAGLTAFSRMSLDEQQTKGIPLLTELSQDQSIPKEWRDLTALILVKARIAYGAKVDEADALLKLLDPALTDKNSPWRVLSAMQAALIAGEMKQDPDAATAYLQGFVPEQLSPQVSDELAGLQAHYETLAAGKKE